MFNRQAYDVFFAKIPAFKSPWYAFLTFIYVVALSAACVAYFYLINRTAPYAPLVSQLIMASIVIVLEAYHLKTASSYREKYGALAYQYHFYQLMIPILVTWHACCFHPAFIGNDSLLPPWVAIGLGIVLLVFTLLTGIHIERAGFHTLAHGLDVYSIFPEEATIVHGEIYGFIRHPLYFAILCITFALALFRNSALSLLAAAIILIPALVIGRLEDKELIGRVGEAHRAYIRNTSALIPFDRPLAFIKLLFSK